MVRIKERYLLVNIIYPPDATKSSAAKVPGFVVQHQPTVERVTPRALLEAIRTQVGLLFGDSGLGALEGNLSGKRALASCSALCARALCWLMIADAFDSEIFVPGHIYIHSALPQSSLPDTLVGLDIHGPCSR